MLTQKEVETIRDEAQGIHTEPARGWMISLCGSHEEARAFIGKMAKELEGWRQIASVPCHRQLDDLLAEAKKWCE